MAELFDYISRNGSIAFSSNQSILGLGNLGFSINLQPYLTLVDNSLISIDSIFGLLNFRSSFNASGDTGSGAGNVISKIADNQTISGDLGSNDIAIIGSSNVINAGAGSDKIAVVGSGNTLNGEGDNDILTAVGDNNILNGSTGDDILKAIGVNNILAGGIGHDTFGLPDRSYLPSNTAVQGQSLIQDFEIGVDKLGLPTITTFNGTSSTSRVLNFNELTMTQQDQDMAISYQGDILAIVKNIQANQINSTDFVNLSDLSLPIL